MNAYQTWLLQKGRRWDRAFDMARDTSRAWACCYVGLAFTDLVGWTTLTPIMRWSCFGLCMLAIGATELCFRRAMLYLDLLQATLIPCNNPHCRVCKR